MVQLPISDRTTVICWYSAAIQASWDGQQWGSMREAPEKHSGAVNETIPMLDISEKLS